MSIAASQHGSTGVTEHCVSIEGHQPVAETAKPFSWTAGKILYSISLFFLAGLAEIGGGWLIFQAIRVHQPFWWGILGSAILVIYGFIPTLQPISNFGRVFAVYGGFFIVMSYAWGWLLSSERPDKGDFIGAGIAVAGVLVAWFWPRQTQKRSERLSAALPQGLPRTLPAGALMTGLTAAAVAQALVVGAGDSAFHWTPATVVLAVFLFFLAGLCEIGGGWLVWQAVREGKHWGWGLLGCMVLVAYGFVPCAQPISQFGRIYAVYGGFFIFLSYAWGWAVDKERPDTGDFLGGTLAIVGVLLAFFFPR